MHALMTLTPFVGSGSVRDHYIILARGQTHLKYTLSFRRSRVMTHTTPRPDTYQKDKEITVPLDSARLLSTKEAPKGPGRHGALRNLPFDPGSLSRCSDRCDISDREACKHSTFSQDTSQPIRRGLTTKDIWHRQDKTGGITVGPSREFVTNTAASDMTRVSRQNGVCLDCAK